MSIMQSEQLLDASTAFAFWTKEGAQGVLQVVKTEFIPTTLRYKLLQGGQTKSATAAISTPAFPLVFGPVIEREICFASVADLQDCFLDLDHNQFVTPPPEVRALFAKEDWIARFYVAQKPKETSETMQAWVRASGADLLADGWQRRLTFLGGWSQDQSSDQSGLIEFDRAEAKKVLQRIEDIDEAMRESPGKVMHLSWLQSPGSYPSGIPRKTSWALHDTHLFRTAAGNSGILQFIGFTQRGVKIRYKLVQTASRPNAPALQSAPEYRTVLVAKGSLTQVVTETGTLNPLPNDPGKWQINAPVAEADIVRVVVGQTVDFTHDAFPDHAFHGKVVQVGTKAVTVQNVVCYEVIIEVTSAEPQFKPGMTADLRIIVAQREDVLTIPNAALRFRLPEKEVGTGMAKSQSERIVYVIRDDGPGQPEPVRIKTGISDGSKTEVTQGLREGNRVVTGWFTQTTNRGIWQSGFRAKAEWQDTGASTPETALQTLLWAGREKLWDCLTDLTFLPRHPRDDWYGSFTNDVPHVFGRIKQCNGVTLASVKYDTPEGAIIEMVMDGVPPNQVAVSKNLRMIRVGTEWKCDYPHDSLVAFKLREKSPAISK